MPEIHQVVIIAKVLISALASSFAILLISKVGLREVLIATAPKLLSKMFDCDFCLSFWINMAQCLFLFCTTGDTYWLVIPVYATPITRLFI